MTTLQRACLTAAVLWVGMHLWLAIGSVSAHPHPWASVIAMMACVAASAWVASPLVTGREHLGRPSAAALTALGLAVALLVAPFLDAQHLREYADWPPGALGVLIAGLVMRRRPVAAATVALGLCAVTVASVTRHGGFDLGWSVSLCVSPLLWLGASALVRSLFDRTASALERYGAAAARAHNEATIDRARESLASARRVELERNVMPLLRRLAEVDIAIDPELRAACAGLESQLRDDLRGRHLLTASLRALLTRIRETGTDARIVDDRSHPDHGPATTAAVGIIEATLPLLAGAQVTYRVVPDARTMTMTAEADASALAEVASRLAELDERHVVDVEDTALYAECLLPVTAG